MTPRSGRIRAFRFAAAIVLAAAACSHTPPATAPRAAGGPPPVLREFRGVWVASVSNIDWPSRPGLTPGEQRAELVAILDRAVELRLNAVILQVRPAADALYPSPHEPWSEYLTGAQGRAPEPVYDPLRFAVDEAHRRGLELHAWFNPYRARHPSATTPSPADHVSRAHPEWVRQYGAYQWLDPGLREVQDHSIRVMMDVVRRYDVDGVHIDDYFYPYPERDSAGRGVDFPDEPSWTAYVRSGGRLARDDWRRRNVDDFVQRLYREIKREKPWVKFGISPFGIWRPGHPPQITTAFDQYAMLYADARKWLREGWMDYFVPQLYWPIARTPQSYPVLLRWWVEENVRGRHLWPGNFTSRLAFGAQPYWQAEEVLGQIYVTRGQRGATGNIHFSERIFRINPDSLVELLRTQAYREPALVPASPWLGGRAPGRPRVSVERGGDGLTVNLEPGSGPEPTWWVVQSRRGQAWTTAILPGARRSYRLADDAAAGEVGEVVVRGIGRNGQEGPAARSPI